jgi:hypothetical protein
MGSVDGFYDPYQANLAGRKKLVSCYASLGKTMRKKYNIGGQEVFGEEVEFQVEKEPFNVYILEDGTTLKLKIVVSGVVRLEAFGPDGSPLYQVQATNVLIPDVPDRLKRRNP